MVGALVNNSIAPLDYKLQDNDIIKIITNKNSAGPSREWLNIVKTNQAKNKIKAFFNRIDKTEILKKGEEIFTKELRKRKIPYNDFMTNENIDKILEELRYNSIDDLYFNIGNENLPVTQVINIIYNENDSKEEIILRKRQNREVDLPTIKNDIIVEGIDEIKVNLAGCCKPIPGDEIVGYITKGYGITVHRLSCPNISDLEERLIEVKWNNNLDKKYPTNILIHTIESHSILMDIIAKTTNNDISVQSINIIKSNDAFMYEITVLVSDKDKLTKFMNDVDSIPKILDVERAIK